jgi:hypothetical protein
VKPFQSDTGLSSSAIIAQGILDGSISLIEGSRQLSTVALAHAPRPLDDDFGPFLTFDDMTCDFPVGEFRRFWATDALAAKDAQAAQVEAQFREILLAACRRLVLRFRNAGEQFTPTI